MKTYMDSRFIINRRDYLIVLIKGSHHMTGSRSSCQLYSLISPTSCDDSLVMYQLLGSTDEKRMGVAVHTFYQN